VECSPKPKGAIHKVPCTAAEAIKSSLMGTFEKGRFKKFMNFIQDYEAKDPKTQNGLSLTFPSGTFSRNIL
jgi:RAB proteins geranylgeranyltransferase component A (RAB escort protein)